MLSLSKHGAGFFNGLLVNVGPLRRQPLGSLAHAQ